MSVSDICTGGKLTQCQGDIHYSPQEEIYSQSRKKSKFFEFCIHIGKKKIWENIEQQKKKKLQKERKFPVRK